MAAPADPADVSVLLETACSLGEGLHWCSRTQRLYFVDILERAVYTLQFPAQTLTRLTLSEPVGWVLPERGSHGLLAGLKSGFRRIALDHGGQEGDWVARPRFPHPGVRLNDAKADSRGAVWAGSMNGDDDSRPDGCLYRLAPDGSCTVVDTGYRVANGPAISPDETLLLHTDSPLRTIYAFDLDVAAGRLSNKRVWLRFGDDEGYPDGMCFDAEGCLWVAHWDGGRITRRDPDGRVMLRVDLPAPRITNVCFGGPGLDRLFVTSARVGMSSAELARYPCAGSVFDVREHRVSGLAGKSWLPLSESATAGHENDAAKILACPKGKRPTGA